VVHNKQQVFFPTSLKVVASIGIFNIQSMTISTTHKSCTQFESILRK
jgi:hypothetical protein